MAKKAVTKTKSRCIIAPANTFGNVDAPNYFCIEITKALCDKVASVAKFLNEKKMDEARESCGVSFSNFDDIEGFTKKEIDQLQKGKPIISAMEFDEILDCELNSDLDCVQLAIYMDGTFSIVINCDGGEIFSTSAKPSMK